MGFNSDYATPKIDRISKNQIWLLYENLEIWIDFQVEQIYTFKLRLIFDNFFFYFQEIV